MKTRVFGGVLGLRIAKFVGFFLIFSDFLSFEGTFCTAAHLDPPVRIGLN